MFPVHKHYFMTTFLDTGDVWFSLRSTTYQNNSLVTLEDIGGDDDALLCITDLTACCPSTGENGSRIGDWFFPNGTEVPGTGVQWSFHRNRGKMMVLMNRRRGGVDGIYRCEISDSMNVIHTIYIGVYTAGTGDIFCTILFCSTLRRDSGIKNKDGTSDCQVLLKLVLMCCLVSSAVVN